MPWVSVLLFTILSAPAVPAKRPASRAADTKAADAAKRPTPTRAVVKAKAPARRANVAPAKAKAPVARPAPAAKPKAAAKPTAPAKAAPKKAAKPAARTKPVARTKAPAKPVERRAPVPPADRQPQAPKTRKEPAKRAAARPAPRGKKPAKRSQPKTPLLPFHPDKTVREINLPNGIECWCKSLPHAQITRVRLAVAAGATTDPKGLVGTANFLVELLKRRLNQPKNPPHSSVPVGGGYYRLELGKEWMLLKARLPSARIGEALSHIANSLKSPPPTIIPESLRSKLKRESAPFPPLAMLEQVEAFLFRGEPHGRKLRGSKRTYHMIQGFRLKTNWERLYRAHRMKLLIVGKTDCEEVKEQVERTFGALPNKRSSKNNAPMHTKSQLRPSGRLFLSQAFLRIYRLPSLTRADFAPLWLLQQIAERELKQNLAQKYGRLPVRTALQTFVHNGYILFSLPIHATQRRTLDATVKKALGTLRMQPYPPALKQRITTEYHNQIDLLVREASQSTSGQTDLLLPQLLLPPKKEKRPRALLPLIQQTTPEVIRRLARKYMGQNISASASHRAPSLPRVFLLIASLLVVWLLLNQTLLRSRRDD